MSNVGADILKYWKCLLSSPALEEPNFKNSPSKGRLRFSDLTFHRHFLPLFVFRLPSKCNKIILDSRHVLIPPVYWCSAVSSTEKIVLMRTQTQKNRMYVRRINRQTERRYKWAINLTCEKSRNGRRQVRWQLPEFCVNGLVCIRSISAH